MFIDVTKAKSVAASEVQSTRGSCDSTMSNRPAAIGMGW